MSDKTQKNERLTAQQRAVLRLISRGKTDKEIAVELRIKENTVSTHVRFILARLRCSSRSQAVHRFFSA